MNEVKNPIFTKEEYDFINKYHAQITDVMHMLYPQLTRYEISQGVDRAISKNIKNPEVIIDNNYKKIQIKSTLLELTQYIYEKQPIITNQGVMFTRHGSMPNPIAKMLELFLTERKRMKKIMFKYPKGSAEFAKYNLFQLLLKIDANGFYGVCGQYSSIYYNLYCASTTTTQGKQANATAALFFEMFMANNVPFESLEELFVFIDNVKNDMFKSKYPRALPGFGLGIREISLEECFFKLLYNCGFDWIPTDDEMELVWKALANLPPEMWTRLYYKNNLFEFCSNQYVKDFIIKILVTLEKPFLDPNSPPDEVKEQCIFLTDLLREFVYYAHQIPSKIEKMDALIRDVSIIQDTDSCIICFDGWYNFVLQMTYGIDMKIKNEYIDMPTEEVKRTVKVPEYDFYTDEIIEVERSVNPITVIPQDGLRHSIINIIGYCTGILLNEYVMQMAHNFGAIRPEGCLLVLKNEFTFRRLLITDAKKHYASYQELQEGNIVPDKKALDVKGMDAFVKSTMNPTTQSKLKAILYEDILNTPVVDQANVIKKIAMVEKEIFESINRGEKTYFKPAKIRSQSAYERPMFIQGIKASVAYNALHEPDTESIDIETRNSVDIVKVEITPRTLDKIKDSYPDVYQRAMDLINTNQYFKGGIETIAIPYNEDVPGWVLPFVRYSEIINDNVGKFPLESIGLYRGNDNNNTTNIISF